MNRGLIWSGALHVALFIVFLLGPGPKALDWDRADAVAVDLVTLPLPEPPKEMPIETPKAPPSLPDPQPEVKPVPPEKVDAEPVPEVKPSPPEPTPAKTSAPPPPKRVFRKYAPPQEAQEPTLAERLQQRLAAAEPETTSAPDVNTPGPALDLPEASETVLPPASTAQVEAVNFPYEWYLNVLRTKITAVWDPPGQRLIAGRERQVVIRFRVHRDGRVTQISTDGASGTPGLDDSARRAVERGGPFPPLPPNYEGDWLDVAVRFTVEGG